MADDTTRDPPKLRILKGGATEKATVQRRNATLDDGRRISDLSPMERELEAFERWHQAFEQLLEVEKTVMTAGQLTKVEEGQASGKAKVHGKLYVAAFFDALGAIHAARARILECREATRHYALEMPDDPGSGKRRSPRKAARDEGRKDKD